MRKLINFAVNLMEKENNHSLDLPSKNSILNPVLNMYLNPDKHLPLNSMQNPKLSPKENPKHWKECQWELFKETPIFPYLTRSQKLMCLKYLKSM